MSATAKRNLNPASGLGAMVAAAKRRNQKRQATVLDGALLGLLGYKLRGEPRKPMQPKEGTPAAKVLEAMQAGPVEVGKAGLTLPLHGALNRDYGQPVVPVLQGGKLAYTVPRDARALQTLLRRRLVKAGWL